MLKSFEGIVDACGLRSLNQAGGSLRLSLPDSDSKAIAFWADVDDRSAAVVLRELIAGNRSRALRLLEESAVSIGTQPARP